MEVQNGVPETPVKSAVESDTVDRISCQRIEEIKQTGISDELKGKEGESKCGMEMNGNINSESLVENQVENTKVKEEEKVKLAELDGDVTTEDNAVQDKEEKILTAKEGGDELNEKQQKEIDDEELKKFNRLVPSDRSTFKKDDVDEHFDKLPWYAGALGRVLSIPFSYGPRFAPINISLRRRMQTFAVFFWMSSFMFMGVGSLFLLIYLFFYSQYWWISFTYFTWYLGDRTICNRGGRRWNFMRKWSLWRSYRDFFPIHLIKTAELDPSKNYIIGSHPHGILSAAAYCNFATEGTHFSKIFPGFTPYLLTLECHFKLPFYREFFMCTGAVSATKDSMTHLLVNEGTGNAICLVVGGAPESLDAHPGQVILHLSKRKGFCKLALKHGASLVPMFSFGENEIYDQLWNPHGSLIRKVQNSLQQLLGLAPVVLMGRGIFQYSFGIVPYRKPIYTVVGSPIDVAEVKNPSSKEIVDLHAKYVKAVIDLYNKYKGRYSEHPELEIQII